MDLRRANDEGHCEDGTPVPVPSMSSQRQSSTIAEETKSDATRRGALTLLPLPPSLGPLCSHCSHEMPALANTHAAPLKPYSRPVIIQPSKPPPDNSAVKVLKPEVFKAAIVVESYRESNRVLREYAWSADSEFDYAASVVYPEDVMGRMAFRLPTGKALTAHQWKVRCSIHMPRYHVS